jgi:Cysteine-rich CPXCG
MGVWAWYNRPRGHLWWGEAPEWPKMSRGADPYPAARFFWANPLPSRRRLALQLRTSLPPIVLVLVVVLVLETTLPRRSRSTPGRVTVNSTTSRCHRRRSKSRTRTTTSTRTISYREHTPIRRHAQTPTRSLSQPTYIPLYPLLEWLSCGLRVNMIFMNLEEDVEVVCPYCGAIFTAFVDTSAGGYATIEDCQVCCRPIELIVGCHAGVIDQVDAARA